MWETLPFGLQRTKHTPSRTKFYQIQFCLNYTSFSQGSIFFHSSLFNGINQLLLQDFAAAFFKSLLILTEIKITSIHLHQGHYSHPHYCQNKSLSLKVQWKKGLGKYLETYIKTIVENQLCPKATALYNTGGHHS